MTISVRQHGGYGPFNMLVDTERNTPKIGGFHLRESNIDNGNVMLLCRFSNHLRLSDAGRSPQHDRCMVPLSGAEEFMVQNG